MKESTQPRPRLPPELSLHIIDIVHMSNWETGHFADAALASSTLSACALTCRSWRDHAQYRLFTHIQLSDTLALKSLTDVIRASPRLGIYVESIILHCDPDSEGSAHPILLFPALLHGLLPHLQRVWIFASGFHERGIAPPLHYHFPIWLSSFQTVTTFILGGTTFASFSTFLRVVNAFPRLTELSLGSVKWQTVGRLPPFMRPVPVQPGSESLPSNRRQFLPQLRELTVRVLSYPRLYERCN